MRAAGNVTVLISGRGSNLKALIQQQSGYTVTHVVTDKATAGGLQWAKEAGIPFTTVERKHDQSLADFKAEILSAVRSSSPDLVTLAGFMVLLQPEFIEAFPGRLLNIHPSLLPAFPGLNTYQRALDAKVSEHGCTVHFVDTGVDTGPLIAQSRVSVEPHESVETLSQKVQTAEHALYPRIVRYVLQGDITLKDRTVIYSEKVRREALELGLTIFI